MPPAMSARPVLKLSQNGQWLRGASRKGRKNNSEGGTRKKMSRANAETFSASRVSRYNQVMASIEVSGKAMTNAPRNVERLASSAAASNSATLKRIFTINTGASQTGYFSLA